MGSKKRAGGVAFALVVISVGCGGETASPPPKDNIELFRSGSRLRAIVYEIGTARQFSGWFDAVLNSECSFRRWNRPDRRASCIPNSGLANGSNEFGDATCTLRVARFVEGAFASASDPQWVLTEPPDSCSSSPVVNAVGDRFRGAVFRKTTAGACEEAKPEPGIAYFNIGAPVSPFVEAVEVVEPHGGRIDSLALITSDGAREVVAGFDNVRGESVIPMQMADRTFRFMPEAVAYLHGHNCREDVASKTASSARCPISVVIDACSNEAFAVERSISIAEAGAGCEEQSGAKLFAVGPRIDASAFAEARLVQLGLGRLRINAFAVGSEIIAPSSWSFFDTKLNHGCRLSNSDQATARCEPSAMGRPSFADRSCQRRALETYDVVCGGQQAQPGDMTTIDGKPHVLVGERIPIFSQGTSTDGSPVCEQLGFGLAADPLDEELVVVTKVRKVE